VTQDEKLIAGAERLLNSARRAVREAKEARNLVKELIAFGTEAQKTRALELFEVREHRNMI
jgi:hypothetical protein